MIKGNGNETYFDVCMLLGYISDKIMVDSKQSATIFRSILYTLDFFSLTRMIRDKR